MALTSWKGSIVSSQYIYIAENYLTEDEIDGFYRFVTWFLETAELRFKNIEDFTIKFWRENIDIIIELNDKVVLKNAGTISNSQMEQIVEPIYEKFDSRRKKEDLLLEDKKEMEELNQLENKIKGRIKWWLHITYSQKFYHNPPKPNSSKLLKIFFALFLNFAIENKTILLLFFSQEEIERKIKFNLLLKYM